MRQVPVSRISWIFSEALADARKIHEDLAGCHEVGDALGQVANRPRAVAVGADAEGVLVLDFQDVGDFLEDGCHLAVFHRHLASAASTTPLLLAHSRSPASSVY